MAQPLLSGLCKIWYVTLRSMRIRVQVCQHDILTCVLISFTSNSGPPKYQCPRCSSRTCSLPCYKRHQKRSQCSGQRDPAAYVKPSLLATPAGIDRDFNFLSGLERSLDRAGREPKLQSILGHGKDTKKKPRGVDADLLGSMLAKRKVRVHRAPVGMSRQRENQTRWNAKYVCSPA